VPTLLGWKIAAKQKMMPACAAANNVSQMFGDNGNRMKTG
jgi:hypothetical protein